MATLAQGLVYTFRRLRKSPGFVLAAVFSIGLGIAANSTIFSIVSRFVLRPAPVGDPATLIALHTTHDGDRCCNNFSYPVFTDVRDQTRSFSGVAAYYELLPASIQASGPSSGEAERVWGQPATANYFDVAQTGMTVGRGFLASEENQPVIVLTNRLWHRHFDGDPAILGKSIALSGHRFTVVGVTPPGFHGLDQILDPEFWVPLGNVEQLAPSTPSRTARDFHWLAVVGRLKRGVTRSEASAELAALATRFATAYPDTDKGSGFLIDQAGSLPLRDKSTVLLFLGALSVVVLLVLAIACANVANLLLAHGAGRQREMAVRLALGATRRQLMRQMLLESLLLGLGGGLVGTVLSWWATSGLSAFKIPAPVPLDVSVNVDWRVLLYTFILSVGTGLVLGLVPAWITSRPLLIGSLKGEDAMARPGRRLTLRNVLVVAQIAMSLVLLCATGLFLRSLQRATGIDIGFRSRNVVMLSVDPRVHGYTPERTTQFLTNLREQAATIPGVISAAETDSIPLSGGHRSDGFHMAGGGKSDRPDPIVDMFMATPGYFETLGIPRIAGRDFANESATSPKVAIVNQTFVQQVLRGGSPVGQRVVDGDVTYEIIGVVKDIKSRTLGEDTRPILFRSLVQSTGSDPAFLGYTLMVRSEADPEAVVKALRHEIHVLDPAMAVYSVETMETHLRSALFLPRLAGTLFGVFGFVGLALAAVGLYGVMSYSVSRRTREIGIRIAVGASLGAVQRLIVGQGMRLTLVAMLVGLPTALVVARFCSSFLYGIRPHDAVTFTLVPCFLAFIALMACWMPARRAARIDLQAALRSE